MLAIQAALRGLTGSLEMSVFQTLSAGNIGQPGAPGTVVPRVGLAGPAREARRVPWLAAGRVAVACPDGPACRGVAGRCCAAGLALAVSLAAVGAVPHAARSGSAAATAAAAPARTSRNLRIAEHPDTGPRRIWRSGPYRRKSARGPRWPAGAGRRRC